MEAKEYLENFQTANRREIRRTALLKLMLLPDPPDIQGSRCMVSRFAGDEHKQPIMKMLLERAYLRYRMVSLGREG